MNALVVERGRAPAQSTVSVGASKVDLLDLATLALFCAVSVWVLGVDLFEMVARGHNWTGTDGVFGVDQLQYLAWIQSAARHLLVSNLYVSHPTPAVYFQPLVAISGGLVALGMAPSLALLVWKPVAVGGAFFAVRALTRRCLPSTGARRAALPIALFGGFGVTGGFGVSYPDLWLPFWSWGYPFGLISLASSIAALLLYERARTAGGEHLWLAAGAAALAGWLHPWQGETLLFIVLGGEAVMWVTGRRPSLVRLGAMVAATALPLAYYGALSHLDRSWRLAEASAGGGYALWKLGVALGPLALPALLAYGRRAESFAGAAIRVWPVAIVATFLLAEHGLASSPMHAFLGISVPLAILAVSGTVPLLARLPPVARTGVAVIGVLLLTVPATVGRVRATRPLLLPSAGGANLISDRVSDALTYLRNDSQRGGVLADFNVGALIPAETGRSTYIGNPFWSQPGFNERAALVNHLVATEMPAGRARQFVQATGARFVVDEFCWGHARLMRQLEPLVTSVRRFGCLTVYTLRS